MRRIILLLTSLLALASLPTLAQQEAQPFVLQAHRGGLGQVTESTLEAFANALELGVSTLDCGSQRAEPHADQKIVPGARMVLLSEVFDLVKRHRA